MSGMSELSRRSVKTGWYNRDMEDISPKKLNSGTNIPAIGFGTWGLNEGWEVKDAVKAALEAGYRLIDTARIYNNEKGVGAAIRGSGIEREDIFVTTKLWTSDQGYESSLRAFEASLGRLGFGYVDLYLIHWPGDDRERRMDSWQTLCQLYSEGRALAIGVSNFEVEHLNELLAVSDTVPAVNQIEFHPFIYRKQAPILELCQEKGIIVEAYSPLAQARYMNNETLESMAQKYGKTKAQIMLRWSVQHKAVPIPKSANPERIKENLQVFDFEISEQDMKVLDGLSVL